MRRNIRWKIPLFIFALLLVSLNTQQAAARDSGSRVRDLGTLGGNTSRAIAINNRGHVVGVSTTATGDNHAFLWKHGRMIDLGTLGGTMSAAFGLNDRDQVVGESTTASGEVRAFLWRKGVMQELP